MNTKRNRGIRALGLKKASDGLYYNPNMYGLEFEKTKNGEIKMIVPEWFKKEHQQKLRTLRNYGKKYGLSNKTDIKKEKDLYKYYVDYVNKWNKGEISKASTVKYRFDLYNQNQKSTNRFYSRENKQKIIEHVNESFKVKVMRIMGKHGVFNGQAYDDYLNNLSAKLGEDKSIIESLVFPTKINEKSSYEQIKNCIENGFDNIDELINNKYESGEIDDNDEFLIRGMLLWLIKKI